MGKQLIDQALHFVIGWGVVSCYTLLVPIGQAIALLMACAILRELWQHDWDTDDLKQGSAVDLAFFLLGGLMVV